MEQDIQVPTTFSHVPHEYVFKRYASSIFYVRATLKQYYKPQIVRRLKDLGATEEQANAILETMKVATGFSTRETDAWYQILTCAHVFEDFYSGTVELTLEQINRWFHVSVLCQHYEKEMATVQNLYSDPSVDPRNYSPATVERFDSSKDLMLLRVRKQDLYADNEWTVCEEEHRCISRYAPSIPSPPTDVIMLAWPACRRDSPLIGRVVSTSRVYGQITQDLTKGYNMTMFELDITGDDGCSGAPILNHAGSLHCVYHGRMNQGRVNSLGYGIAAAEVLEFLWLLAARVESMVSLFVKDVLYERLCGIALTL